MEIVEILQTTFGLESFRKGQEEIIRSVLNKQNTFGILATGTGKSLTYQLPSVLFGGTTLIVSPLLSLMEDQVRSVQKNGEKRVIALNSQLIYEEKQYVLKNLNQYKFIFASPEMLLQEEVQVYLRQLNCTLFVIDEAHCISQWGMDFRPEYMQLQKIVEILHQPTILALTATATPLVQKDIEENLFPNGVVRIKQSMERANIALVKEETADKDLLLLNYLRVLSKMGTGIVYTATRK